MIKALLALIGGTVAFWALVSVAARLLWPEAPTWWWSTAAALVCLAPTALTLAWTHRAYAGKPEQQLAAIMGGTALRMVVAVAAALVLFYAVQTFRHQRFWYFVVAYYLFTLALEMVVLMRATAAQQVQPKG